MSRPFCNVLAMFGRTIAMKHKTKKLAKCNQWQQEDQNKLNVMNGFIGVALSKNQNIRN